MEPEKTSIARQWLGRHILMTTVTYTKAEQLLEKMFSMWLVPQTRSNGENSVRMYCEAGKYGSWVPQSLELRMTTLVGDSSDFTDTKTSPSIKQQVWMWINSWWITVQQRWHLLRKTNPSSCQREVLFSKHASGLERNQNMVMDPGRAWNREWLCCQRPTATYCSSQSVSQELTAQNSWAWKQRRHHC